MTSNLAHSLLIAGGALTLLSSCGKPVDGSKSGAGNRGDDGVENLAGKPAAEPSWEVAVEAAEPETAKSPPEEEVIFVPRHFQSRRRVLSFGPAGQAQDWSATLPVEEDVVLVKVRYRTMAASAAGAEKSGEVARTCKAWLGQEGGPDYGIANAVPLDERRWIDHEHNFRREPGRGDVRFRLQVEPGASTLVLDGFSYETWNTVDG